MGTAVIVLGSITGFLTAILAYFVFEAAILSALAIWIGSGPLSALLVMVSNRARPAAQDRFAQVETA
jgi:hypothetical protein